VDAVHDIAARFRFDVGGDRVRAQTPAESDAARRRAGVGSVPVPGGSCHEMNNVRADGKGCPVFYRCFSCRFFTTEFTHLPQLRDVRAAKAEHLARLQASYGTVLRAGPLTDASLRLLSEEIAQLDALIGKCATDLASLTDSERQQVERWLHARDRYATVIRSPHRAVGVDELCLGNRARRPGTGQRRARLPVVTAAPHSGPT
jgi:hypothetical protein